MSTKRHSENSVRQSHILVPYSKIKSKQIQDGNLVSSDDVKNVRDLFIFSEKHCETKSFSKMEAWINEGSRKTKRVKRDFQHSGNFLTSVRTEASSEATYKFVPSPEFKPGSYFLLPENPTSSNYTASRIDRCVPSYTYFRPSNQLCKNNVTRKEFCEVFGKELCLDCNGRRLRETFNYKMNALYPCLEYDKDKRPYGYCPRAVRLTEPLPSRVDRRPKSLTLPGSDRATLMGARGISTGRDKTFSEMPIQVFIKPRPYTS